MKNKQKSFADDGWAVWIDGDDVSTVYLNDWLNPQGKSFVDLAVRIRGVRATKSLNVYIPFRVSEAELTGPACFLFPAVQLCRAQKFKNSIDLISIS